MLAIVAPGQGAQTPGFLTDWLSDADFDGHLRQLGASAELDLEHFGTHADADEIRDTAVAQPLLVASAIATARALLGDGLPDGVILAGHSVGELAAAAIAGVLPDADAMMLVRERGRAMALASAARPTSMTAVIGGDPAEVLEAIESAGLTAANNNGKGQIVAAGTIEQLEAFAEQAPRRTRLFPLSVAGAFHTVHMEPAVAHLSTTAADVSATDPTTPLLTNSDGSVLTTGDEVLARIVSQVANPVRWDLCMATMAERGVTGMLELTPAGTLVGIAKRNLPGVETFALSSPDQLDEARAFVASHTHQA